MEDEQKAIVRVENEISTLPVESILDQAQKINDVMALAMKVDIHYGKIPGCGPKPTLLKPGAEKICQLFQFYPKYEIEQKTGNGAYIYNITCSLYQRGTDKFVGQGVGCANTKERKFSVKKNGEKIPAPDILNTVLKIAKKRAFVDAVIANTACSDVFTQDIEEMKDIVNQQRQTPTQPTRTRPEDNSITFPPPVVPLQEIQKAHKEQHISDSMPEMDPPKTFSNQYGEYVLINETVPEAYWKEQNKKEVYWDKGKRAIMYTGNPNFKRYAFYIDKKFTVEEEPPMTPEEKEVLFGKDDIPI